MFHRYEAVRQRSFNWRSTAFSRRCGLYCWLTANSPPAENILVGKVISVADGDTVTILVGKTQHRVRLHGVDCPNSGQTFRIRAKQFTADKTFGTRVSATVLDTGI